MKVPPYKEGCRIWNSSKEMELFLKDQGISLYRDLSVESLRMFRQNHGHKVWSVISILVFYGVMFEGKLEKYNVPVQEKNILVYKGEMADELIHFPPLLQASIGNFLMQYGLRRPLDFIGVSLETLLFKLSDLGKSDTFLEQLKDFLQEQTFVFVDIESFRDMREKDLHSTSTRSEWELSSERKQVTTSLDDKNEKEEGGTGDKIFFYEEKKIAVPLKYMDCEIDPQISTITKLIEGLEEKGIRKFSDLPERLEPLLASMSGVGIGKINSFLEWLGKVDDGLLVERVAQENFEVKQYSIEDFDLGKGWHATQLDDYVLLLPPELAQHPLHIEESKIALIGHIFQMKGYRYFRDLPPNLTKPFLEFSGVGSGKKKVLLDWMQSMGALRVHEEGEENPLIGSNSFEEEAEKIAETFRKVIHGEHVPFCKEEWIERFRSRMNGFGEKMNSLEIVGKMHGITRERVRQVISKVVARMIEYHARFFSLLEEKVEGSSFIQVKDVFRGTVMEGLAEDKKKSRLLELIINESTLSFFYYPSSAYFSVLSKEEIEEERSRLLSDLKEKCTPCIKKEYFSTLLEEYIKQKNFRIPLEFLWGEEMERHFTTGETLVFAFISKRKILYELFRKEFPNGLSLHIEYQRLAEAARREVPQLFSDTSERYMVASIMEYAKIWGRGFWIPIESIQLSNEEIKPIHDWLIEIVNEERVHQVNLNTAVIHFKEELKSIGIDNPYALYSALQMCYPNSFYYRKAPRIEQYSENVKEKLSMIEIIEKYLLEAGGPVSMDGLRAHFIDKQGWKTFTLEQRLTNDCEKALRYDKHSYVHLDVLDYDVGKLEYLKDWVLRFIKKMERPISLEDIKPSLLRLANVKSGYLLYELFEEHFEEEFEFLRVPFVYRKDAEDPTYLKGTYREQVEEYLIKRGEPVFRSELENEFLSAGWREVSLHNAIYTNDSILPLVRGAEYVHENVLNISDSERERIHQEVVNYYKQKEEVFVRLSNEVVFQELKAKLPPLKVKWTPDLLVVLCRDMEHIILLGAKQEVIVGRNNKQGIYTEQDALAYILKEKFNGAASLKEMIEVCKEQGLMGEKQFASMIQEEEEMPYLVNDTTIWLKELEKSG